SGDIRFSAPVNVGGLTTEATFTGTITGNEMRGTVVVVGRSSGTFTGTRPGGPPASATPPPRTTTTPPSTTTTPPAQPGMPPAPPAASDLSGTWAITYDVGGQSVPGTLTLRQHGNTLTGTIQSSFGTSEIGNGSIGPDGFRFTTTETVQGRAVEITVTGTATGKELRGAASSQIGTMTFTGTKPQWKG
nr:hypothetical protein [Acidobacteriota bacterium]